MPGVEALGEAGGHGTDEDEGRLAAGLAPAHKLKVIHFVFMFSNLTSWFRGGSSLNLRVKFRN